MTRMISLPKNTLDETGHRYGRLLVSEYAGTEGPEGHGAATWRCQCDCGNEALVRGSKLRIGLVVSCGCERADPAIRQAARMQTSARRRKAIARMGGQARARLTPAET